MSGPVVGVAVIWERDGRLYTRVRTNVSERRLRERLCEMSIEGALESCRGCADPLRMNGGTGFVLIWRAGTRVDEVRKWLEAM
jgi:hypothetical protein